jgi:hypothetical protein
VLHLKKIPTPNLFLPDQDFRCLETAATALRRDFSRVVSMEANRSAECLIASSYAMRFSHQSQ